MLLVRLERDRDRILRWIVPRSSSSHDWVRCIVIPVGRGEGREGGEGRRRGEEERGGGEGRRRGGEERRDVGERRRGREGGGYCYKSHTVMDTPHWSESPQTVCTVSYTTNLKHV